ncbi:putative Receptor like protein 1 [Tripterygium wilfordii]|uniref:Putative Receptor like protein 1 n=1 Tax=Tripterygium wilfordii TaxID=458696 RepID=A0A7J7CM51_TRIWF|nr:putative Receptor like protein 1 [Tripterygium wilfordii]
MRLLLVYVYRAILLCFICISCFFNRSEGSCSEVQRRALLEIRNSTDDFSLSNWEGEDCCQFEGVDCEFFPGLGAISLSRKKDSKTWYPNVTLFTVLQDLIEMGLSGVRIGGPLQAFCELKKLKKLQWLDLSNNVLEGSIPTCFGTMKSLYKLDLSNNRLSGNIPLSIFINQSRFGVFDVSNNNLEGYVPFSILADQAGLFYIDLSKNYHLEVETESPSWVPTFALIYLGLGNCNLNEKSGHVVPSFISSQPSLQWLDLSHNSLEGSIPCSLFYNNSITGLFLRGKTLRPFLLGAMEVMQLHRCLSHSTYRPIISKGLCLKTWVLFSQY